MTPRLCALCAAVGHAIFGTPEIAVIGSVLLGAIPAIMLGAHFYSRGADRYIKPALFSILLISSLKLLEPTKGAFNGLVLALAIGAVFLARGWIDDLLQKGEGLELLQSFTINPSDVALACLWVGATAIILSVGSSLIATRRFLDV